MGVRPLAWPGITYNSADMELTLVIISFVISTPVPHALAILFNVLVMQSANCNDAALVLSPLIAVIGLGNEKMKEP